MKRNGREIIFFVLLFLVFFLIVKLYEYWNKHISTYPELTLVAIGVVYTLLMVAIFFIAKLQNREGFWDVSPAAQCKGSPYMWQGDSAESKMCRELASTPAGRCALSSYNCSKGYIGAPMSTFVYSPLSDSKWKNTRCDDSDDGTCGCPDDSLCSLNKYV